MLQSGSLSITTREEQKNSEPGILAFNEDNALFPENLPGTFINNSPSDNLRPAYSEKNICLIAGYPIQDYPHLDYHIQHTLDSSVTMNHCFTLHIVKWRLRKWCQFLSTEKLASKILCLHKCTIFCHSYFIRAKLHPF